MKTVWIELNPDQITKLDALVGGEKKRERWIYLALRKQAGSWKKSIDTLLIRGELEQKVARRLARPDEPTLDEDQFNVFVHTPEELDGYKPEVRPVEAGWSPKEGNVLLAVRVPDEVLDILWVAVAMTNLWYTCLNENKPSASDSVDTYPTFEAWSRDTVLTQLVNETGKMTARVTFVEEDELYPGAVEEVYPSVAREKLVKRDNRREVIDRWVMEARGKKVPEKKDEPAPRLGATHSP